MVTFPIDFPTTIGIEAFSINLRTSAGRTQSPFSFTEQVIDFGGAMWEISVQMPLMNRPTAEDFNSFLLKLRGRKGTFRICDPGGSSPRGSFAGTPLVDGALQTGSTIDLKGFTASQTDVIKAGDYMQIGTGASTRLYKFLDDYDSDSSGLVAAANIAPDLRSSPADSATIITSDTKGLFRLADNLQGISINSDSFYSINFKALEALDGT